MLGACTAAPPPAAINDPFEQSNRDVHEWNKRLDSAFSGGGSAERTPVPEGIALPVRNFAANSGLPSAVVNGILQGDIGGAATNTFRFMLNTTIGIGGILDPAGAIGLHEEETDFGETLHVWGVPEGAYLELPVLGPSTERDATGRVVDMVLNPLERLAGPDVALAGTVSRLADNIIDRRNFGSTIDDVLYGSADSYAQSRLIYLQNRRFELGIEAPSTDVNGEAEIDPFALDLEGFE